MIRLLVVEDNPTDQELVRRGFRDPGLLPDPVDITVTESIEAALGLLQREAFTVILADYSLPGRTGLDLLHELERMGDSTPLIMLTGSVDAAIAVTALQDGAADFIIKDIGYERVLAVVVRRVLEKRALTSTLEPDRGGTQESINRLERRLDVQARELKRALQESEVLRRIGQRLSSTPELADALDLVSRTAAQLLQGQAAAILLRHGPELVLVNSWGVLRQPVGMKHADLAALLAGDWIATADAILREDGGPMGRLWVGRTCHGPFAAHEIDLLEALADLTALSIAKLRMREQLRRLREGATFANLEPPPTDTAPVPQAERSAEPGMPPAEPLIEVSDPAEALDQRAVLVVDDSAKVLMQARLALQDTMTVLTATSGKLAIEKYAATRPAVVLIDLVMPEMDGLATLAELRKLGCTTCLALAVRGDATAHERARKAGYLGVIEKPFREGDLAAQIAKALAFADGVTADHFSEEDGYPVLTLPNPSLRALAKLLPLFDRQLRTLAEEGSDRLIVDATNVTQITPEHISMLVRLFFEAATLGIQPVICAADDGLIAKLRQIVELRDARYVPSREAAKLVLQ